MTDFRVELIRGSRLRFGEAPRSFDRRTRRYVRVKPPLFAIGLAQHLKATYTMHPFLLRHGQVVWGALVVAKTDLLAKGYGNGRAVIVYCPHYHLHDDLLRLTGMAHALVELRSRNTRNSIEQEFFRRLNSNHNWFAPEPVPEALGGDGNALFTSILVVRKHLPGKLISGQCFPVLTHPDTTSVAVLPERYWPDDLRASWTGRA